MDVVSVIAGAAIVVVVLREVFHTLFHPAGRGDLTMLIFRAVWALSGRLGDRARGLAGPASVALVIAAWIAGMALGWSLVYWPSLPDGFIFSSPLDRPAQDGFVDALYFAWVTQSTLGYGDVAPAEGVLRLLAPLHATLGFGLFTMAVTWVLSIYPALQRQRSAASLAHAIRASHRSLDRSVSEMPPATLARQLERLSQLVSSVHVDFVQYPSTFYFAPPSRALALAEELPYVASLARAEGLAPEVQPVAAELVSAVESFSLAIAEQYLGVREPDVDTVLAAYRDHAVRKRQTRGAAS